jgi:hypothetical protein
LKAEKEKENKQKQQTMNSSFSTIEESGNNGSRRLQPNPQHSHMSSIRQQTAESSCTASILDEISVERRNRYSPSFNDSEPPSYFDVIGAGSGVRNVHRVINFNADGISTATPTRLLSTSTQLNSPSMQLPKIVLNASPSSRLASYNKDDESAITTANPSVLSYVPNHYRQPVLASRVHHNLPQSLNPNQVRYSDAQLNNSESQMTQSTDSIQKPCQTYLAWSIFTTFYCVFIGIPALVLSIRVSQFNKQGLYQKAYTRSKIAKYLNVTGLFFGFVYLGAVVLTVLLPRR